jgi:Uma2 family endonuclease
VSWPLPEQFTFAPDLAIEVFSSSNRETDMLEKIESYLEAGTQLAWVAYPAKRAVNVCRRNPDGSLHIRKVDINGVLDDEDVLPGFKLAVKAVFPPEG